MLIFFCAHRTGFPHCVLIAMSQREHFLVARSRSSLSHSQFIRKAFLAANISAATCNILCLGMIMKVINFTNIRRRVFQYFIATKRFRYINFTPGSIYLAMLFRGNQVGPF